MIETCRCKESTRNIQRNYCSNSPNVLKFGTHRRSFMNSNEDKYKEIHTHMHRSKITDREEPGGKNGSSSQSTSRLSSTTGAMG